MTQSLDAEITAFVNELEELREKHPVDEVGQVLEDMFDAQDAAGGKALNEQAVEYKTARDALAKATDAVRTAKENPSQLAEAVNQSKAAVKAVLTASST